MNPIFLFRLSSTNIVRACLLGCMICGGFAFCDEEPLATPVIEEAPKLKPLDQLLFTKVVLQDPDLLKDLLGKGANPHAQSSIGAYPILVAAEIGAYDAIEILLNAGADITVVDGFNRSALYYAVDSNHIHCVHLLLEKGAPVQSQSQDESILVRAIFREDRHLTDRLLAHGADVNIPSYDIYPLSAAIRVNDLQLTRNLLERGAHVTVPVNSESPVLSAARARDPLFLKMLVEKGADIRETDTYGFTALHTAVYEKNLATVEYLLELGANVNQADDEGSPPLFLAFTSPWSTPNLSLLKQLVDAGADVNHRNELGQTAMFHCCHGCHAAEIQVLLDAGASANDSDNTNNSPLHIAVSNHTDSSLRAVKLLVEHGADVNARNSENETPLQIACDNNYKEVARYLLPLTDLSDLPEKSL